MMNTFDISVKKHYFLSWVNPFKGVKRQYEHCPFNETTSACIGFVGCRFGTIYTKMVNIYI